MISICYESSKKCNLSCDYCITSDNKDAKIKSTFPNIIKQIALFSPQRIVVSGGEPLLDELLISKLSLLREECRTAYISLSTNGTIKYDFEKIKEFVDCIDISLPSLNSEVYSKMRGFDFVESVKENIETVKESGIYLRLSTILTKFNYGEIDAILEFAKSNKVDELRIGRYLPLRDAFQHKEKYEVTEKCILEITKKLSESNYEFKIVPPISNLETIQNGYLTVNYLGELFLPTINGKKIIGNIADINIDNIKDIISNQKDIFYDVKLKKSISSFFPPNRIRKSESLLKKDICQEFYSDRTRIIYSSSFRRLQQKAQVFSLESNSSVRSRLTHSIEVSDVGRVLADRIANRLIKRKYCNFEDKEKIISIVENVCLLHDIGNPPFGHFGEKAIIDWWNKNKNKLLEKNNLKDLVESELKYTRLLADFEFFDGNPQGFRVVTRLHSENNMDNQEIESGLNLTYATLLSMLKYVKYPLEEVHNVNQSIIKKAGYFYSEKKIVEEIYGHLKLDRNKRFPWVYLMEAADDIAYAMSDISDAIEKDIISLQFFIVKFQELWREEYKTDVPEEIIQHEQLMRLNEIMDFNKEFASRWASIISNEIVNEFDNNLDSYLLGDCSSIIESESIESKKILKIILLISRKYIYRSNEAEDIEIAGYAVIKGLLDFFGELLYMPYSEFCNFVEDGKSPEKQNIDIQWRIFNRISKRCVNSYKYQIKEWGNQDEYNSSFIEWWLRVHLILDHVTGMTDEFALKTYQVCKGIEINII